MSLARNWCFTINNWNDGDCELLEKMPTKFLIYGKETGENGTPHLQGYVQMQKKIRLTGLKKLHRTAHWEIAKGSPQQNIEYCSKDGDVYRKGVVSVERERNDLRKFMEDVKEGMVDPKLLRENHPEVMAMYPRFAEDYVQDHEEAPLLKTHPLKEWQQELNQVLNREPDDRSIMFVVDPRGGAGKTWFAKYYCSLHENAQVMEMGKRADMAHALRTNIRVLFINCTRDHTELLQYGFLEAVKDGMVFSGKYNSRTKRIGLCHVVVLMNQEPDRSKLSEDRIIIINP